VEKEAQPHPNIAYAVCLDLVAIIAGINVCDVCGKLRIRTVEKINRWHLEPVRIASAKLLPQSDANGMAWFFFASAASNGLASTAHAARQPDPLL
jgi:hypothetical protein